MYCQSILLSFASLAALVSCAAIPEADASKKIEARASPGFYFCKDTNYGPPCYYDTSPYGNCVTVGSNFNDNVSSAGPDQGNHCILYADQKCNGAQATIYSPGSSNLANQNFNDVMSSFRCYAN